MRKKNEELTTRFLCCFRDLEEKGFISKYRHDGALCYTEVQDIMFPDSIGGSQLLHVLGERRPVPVRGVIKFAETFAVDLDWLLNGSSNDNPLPTDKSNTDPKTVIEWLQKAKSEGYLWADEAILHCTERNTDFDFANSLADAVDNAFNWIDARERKNSIFYWENIYAGLIEQQL